MIKIKRAYEIPEKSDGYRILVDRLWPRGISKKNAQIDLWLKEIAPSIELRKWFNHEVEKWPEFQKKYKEELKAKKTEIEQLKAMETQHKTITLIYGAKDEQHNNAVILQKLLA